jgi:TetR/AcrR family transcriptional regulator of autoinduction and epiphytic fitness
VGETSVTAPEGAASEGAPPGGALPAEGDEGAAVEPAQDGRITRAARTRIAVVDALLALNERGKLRPTARDIATEAGVSLRSVYVHFDDLEALFVAAAERYTAKLAAVLDPPQGEGTFTERLESFLARRARIHETYAGPRRAAALQEPFSPVLQQAVNSGRTALRADVRFCFRPEIAAAGADGSDGAERLKSALYVVTSPAAWDALRLHQGLSVEDAVAHLRDMILAFVAAWVPAGRP